MKAFAGAAARKFALSGVDAIGREAGLIALQALIEKVTNPEGLTKFEKGINNCIYKPQLDVSVDVAGLDQVIIDLERMALGPLLFPEKYIRYSELLAAPKGILLHGPPGTGKTMLAKMIANNGGIALINISSSALVSKYSGESEKMIDALFSVARRLEPCIIFIDEIDAILGKRSDGNASHTTSLKAEFLLRWDGLTSSSATGSRQRVLVMGSTNRKDAIDEAFLRRMPLQIHIGLPNIAQRVQLLKHFLRGTPGAETLDLVKLARRMDGFSGSVIEDCCKDACLNPVNESMDLSSVSVPSSSSPPLSVQPLAFADFFTEGVLHHAHRVPGNHIRFRQSDSRTAKGLFVLCTAIAILLLAWIAGYRLFQSMTSMRLWSKLTAIAIQLLRQPMLLAEQLHFGSAKLTTWAKTRNLSNMVIASKFAISLSGGGSLIKTLARHFPRIYIAVVLAVSVIGGQPHVARGPKAPGFEWSLTLVFWLIWSVIIAVMIFASTGTVFGILYVTGKILGLL